jgi:hypothetical protein
MVTVMQRATATLKMLNLNDRSDGCTSIKTQEGINVDNQLIQEIILIVMLIVIYVYLV